MRELNHEQLRRLCFDYIASGRTMPVSEYFEKNKSKYTGAREMTDVELQIYKLTEHVANLEAEVALLNNAVSAQPALRDQFAMAVADSVFNRVNHEQRIEHELSLSTVCSAAAEECYAFADAMLEERNK